MAPSGQKANFKTYDSAVRLLAAVIATTNCKLDFKEIQKLFGESTSAGLEFQFRDIKKLGKAQKAAVAKGEDPSLLNIGATHNSTPMARPTATPGSRKRGAASNASTPTASTKRGAAAAASAAKRKQKKIGSSDEASEDDDSDYEKKDSTPLPASKKRKRASATAAEPASTTDNVEVSDPKPKVVRSLFGNSMPRMSDSAFLGAPPDYQNKVDDDELVEIDAHDFANSKTNTKSTAPSVGYNPFRSPVKNEDDSFPFGDGLASGQAPAPLNFFEEDWDPNEV